MSSETDNNHFSFTLRILIGLAAAGLVLYFMHLRYDSPFNSLVFLTGLVFLLLFLGITILDTIEYQPAVYDAFTKPN